MERHWSDAVGNVIALTIPLLIFLYLSLLFFGIMFAGGTSAPPPAH